MTRCSYEADMIHRQSQVSCKADAAVQTGYQRTITMASKMALIASLIRYTARLPFVADG
jgi:hypothetical protein